MNLLATVLANKPGALKETVENVSEELSAWNLQWDDHYDQIRSHIVGSTVIDYDGYSFTLKLASGETVRGVA